MNCRSCKNKPATGTIFDLCDECFNKFEAKIYANSTPDTKYNLSDGEADFINNNFIDRSKS